MIYEARRFVRSSYERSDSPLKQMLSDFLVERGHTILHSEEDSAHDIVTEMGGRAYYFEVEAKATYLFTNKDSFPFDTVSFLGRKYKLHMLHPFQYIIVCPTTGWALSCYSSQIFKEDHRVLLSIRSHERQGLDEFYRVPKQECIFFPLK